MTMPAFPAFSGTAPNPRTQATAAFNANMDDLVTYVTSTLPTGADAYAAAVPTEALLGVQGTSSSSVAIGTGSKAFSIAGKSFAAGMWVSAHDAADPTVNYMVGQVASYSDPTLTITVPTGGNYGSGTKTSWNIYLAGARGAAGSAGAVADLTGLGTGVATALAVNTGTAGCFVVNGGAGGTPSSLTLTNATGLPATALVADTTTAVGFGSINLGHASDTTITRASAGVIAVEGVNVLLTGGALGTPASGTLTNCTGLPAAALVTSTSQAVGFGSIELGHASDTTIARVSAGLVSIEGVNIVTVSATQTLTGKTLTAPTISNPVMVGSIVEDVFLISDGAGFVIDPTNGSMQTVTLGANRTPTAANWTSGQGVLLKVDDGTARTITWTTIGVVWEGGSAPTLATSGFTHIALWLDGAVYRGKYIGSFAS